MLEEQLDGPLCRFAGTGVTGGCGVLLQPPRGAQGLVERRPVAVGLVSQFHPPSGHCQEMNGLGKPSGAFVSCESEPRTRAERVAMDAGVRTRQPVDHPWRVPQTVDDPGEDMFSGGCDARVADRRRELGQRDQPPMRAGPLAVRIASEPAVRPAARQATPTATARPWGLLGPDSESSPSRSRRARYRTDGSSAASSHANASAVSVSTAADCQITRPVGPTADESAATPIRNGAHRESVGKGHLASGARRSGVR